MHDSGRKINYALRYTLFGVLVGLCFPVTSTLSDILVRGLPVTLMGLWQAQSTQPLLWMIDSAPLILGMFAYVAGLRHDQIAQLVAELDARVVERTTELEKDVAEHKRMAEELRESRERFELAAKGANDGIWDWRIISDEHYFSSRWKSMLGYADDEIKGSQAEFEALVHPDDLPRVLKATQECLDGEAPMYEVEMRMRHKDGSYRWILSRGQVLRGANGRPYRMAGSHTDITARKQAEEALRESENRLRTIIEGTQALLVSVDAHGRFTYANDATAKAVGYATAAELTGKPYLHFVHPEDRKRTLKAFLHQAKTRQPSSFHEFRIVDTAGNVKWFSFLANLVIQDGQVIGQTGVAQEITDRKRAEQELERRANEFAALYETTRDLTTQQDLPTLLRSIVERAAGLVAAPNGSIYLYDAARGDLQLTLATDPIVPIGTRIELGEGMAGRVAQTHQPLIVNDYSTWSHRAPQYEGLPFGAVVEVPVLYGGELVGVLAVEETRGKIREFTDADARLLSLFAGQAASAVRNARLFQEINIHAEQMAVLNKLGRSLITHLDLDQVLDETYREVSHLLATDDFFVALYNAEKDETTFPVGTRDGQLVKPNTVRPGGQGIAGYIIRNQTPVLVNGDLDAWRAQRNIESVGNRPDRKCLSWLGVPMMVGEQVLGVIAVQNFSKPYAYDDRDQQLLAAIASQTAIAIQNARLYAQARQHAQRQEALYRISNDLANLKDERKLCEAVVRACGDFLGYPYLGIFLVDRETGDRVLYAQSGWDDAPKFWRLHPGEGVTEQALLTGELKYWPDVTREPSYVQGIRGTRSEADVPIKTGNTVFGVMAAEDTRVDAFDQGDFDVLQAVANQLAVAVENARLFVQVQQELAERKQAEEALAEERNLLRTLIDAVPDYIFVKDAQSRYLVNNAAHLRSLNATSQQDVLGKNAFDFYPREQAERLIADDQKLLQSGKPILNKEERRRDMGTGQEIWNLATKVPIRDSQGNVIGLVGVGRNITERKQAEAELARQKQYFESLVVTSPVAIVTLDQDQRVTECNLAFENLFGYTREQVIGRDLDTLVTSAETRADAHVYTQQVMQGGMVHGVGRRRRQDGTLVDVEIFGVPVVVEDQQVGVLGMYHDISDLVQAREQAEAADRAKSAFLAAMSHEIRTPLNGVIGMTGLLLDTPLNAQQRQFAETIRFSGENLLTIINDILDFSKIEAGRMELETTDFDLRQVVESIGALFAERAYQKGLELIASVDPNVPTALRGDPFRLGQVLTNLIGNALKFTERGEVALRVRLLETQERRVTLSFAVKDTGIGVSSEQQARLFKPFSQADTSTTRKYGGTGLGLVISKRLIEIMGGQIVIDSQPGQGSTFWFTLQLEQGAPDALKRPVMAADLQGVRALIVDDNATNRTVLHHQVIAWGMLPNSASNAVEALEKLRAASTSEPFDVALLDMEMPGMDGTGLARAIRADPALQAVKLILLTSVGRIGGDAAVQKLGLDAALVKPVRQSELYNCLITVLGVTATDVGAALPTVPHATKEEGKGIRVLLAEDNAVNQQVAMFMLQARGYQVDVAGNGSEALEALARMPYALVLMDCQMPEVDGFEATAEIRKREGSARHTPIIALTAHALRGERDKCIAAGMDDYLSKPITPDVLYATLRRWLPGSVARTEPVPADIPLEATALVSQAVEPLASEEEPIINPAVLESFRQLQEPDGPDIVAQLIDLFLSELPTKLAAVQQAIEYRDATRLSKAAHTLKGSSANMGAQRAAQVCLELERLGKAGDLTGAADLFTQLEQECERVREALGKAR